VRSLIEHGGEAEDAAVAGLIDEYLLVILVNGRDAHAAGYHHVCRARWLADFEDALTRCELAHVDLRCEDGQFIVIEKFKEGDVFEFLRIAGHNGVLALGMKCRDQITAPKAE
jgi:hypothetical protein